MNQHMLADPALMKKKPEIYWNMLQTAEQVAKRYGMPKERMDHYGAGSQQKACAAQEQGLFKDEIVPVKSTRADGSTDTHHIDEGIRFDVSLDGIKGVKLIAENGKLTAASASQMGMVGSDSTSSITRWITKSVLPP